MLLQGLATLVLFTAPGHGAPGELDSSLSGYYTRAISAAEDGEIQKALAMFELLLIPRTEVLVDYRSLNSGTAQQFKRGVERGFAMWRDCLGDDLPFQIVDSASLSNPMRITFVESLPGNKANHKGELQTTRKVRWSTKVRQGEFQSSITIVRHSVGDRNMTESEIAHVIGHELGHALGLDDSSSFERIMGPVVIGDPYARVHPEEVNAVKAFRRTVRVQINRLLVVQKR